jgi:hypothetical protein
MQERESRAMTEGERAFFHNQLIEANRALITLGAIDPRERSPLTSPAIRDCFVVYTQLLNCQDLPLSPDESATARMVADRLKTYLRLYGEDV